MREPPYLLYMIVVDSKSRQLYVLLLLSPSNSSTSSLLYPSAFVDCWWDPRRDSLFSYLRIILVLGVFQGLCGVRIITVLMVMSKLMWVIGPSEVLLYLYGYG
jgi:hypothetical protein